MSRRRVARLVAIATLASCAASCSLAATPPPDNNGSASSAASGAGPPGCPTNGPKPMASNATATVTITTAKGTIVIKVEGKLGPLAAANFVALADCHYYDGVIFHRLVPGFIIQGGDGQYGRTPNVDQAKVGQGGPDYLFADDPVSVPYTRGTVAMANSGPDTNGSQFFIVLADNGLPPQYSVFGHVMSGMDTVDTIAAMPNSGDPNNAALDPVPMTTVRSTTP
ncbi:MAG: peptidylprolyl isomerase [Candidatus Limnocylindrales bacterium]